MADKYKYAERTRLIDVRLVISGVAVGLALFALLWDWLYPYPVSGPIMIFCVLSYFVLMTLLQCYSWFVEAGVFFVAVDEDPTGTQHDTFWYFTSKLKRFEHMFTLEVKRCSGKDESQAKLEKSIVNWVDDNGEVQIDRFNTDVFKIHDSLMITKKKK